MKYVGLLLTFSLFIGCNGNHQNDQSDSGHTVSDTAKQWLSWDGNGEMPHIVLISGDEEYRSEEALPQLAKILSEHHGFRTTVLFAQDPEKPGVVDPNYSYNIPGLEHLASADMMVIFTRFRALPDEQMKYIDDFLKSGKPVLGMRTATHAFKFDKEDFATNYAHYGNYYNGEDEWKDGFGRLVLGEHWISHHGKHGGQSTKGLIAPAAEGHPILNGIKNGDVWGPTDVYGVRLPLPEGSKPLLLGQVTDREADYDENDPLLGMRPTDTKVPGVLKQKNDNGEEISFNQNDPMMPVAWTRTYQLPDGKPGKCFATTMGASSDLLTEGTRRMLVNAVFWGLELPVPEKANVNIVGSYKPSRFAFHDDEYWDEKNMVIAELK